MDERRTQRVSEAVREELSELIAFELSDPRVDGISVTFVELSPDGKLCHVRVSLPEGEDETGAIEALDRAAPYIRRQLAQRLTLRRVPELSFSGDRAGGAAARVELLLKRAKRGRKSEASQ